jgi:DNA-binding NtrC family response regulator
MLQGNDRLPAEEMAGAGVLIIDDDAHMRRSLEEILRMKGFEPVSAGSGAEGLAALKEHSIGVVLIDLSLPDFPGTVVLERVRDSLPSTQAIILTGNSTVESAVECMKEGACDYLVKPIQVEKLIASIARAMEIRSLKDEFISMQQTPLPNELENEEYFAAIVTRNRQMREIFRYLKIIAVSRQPVLITGETGVGKELFARALHQVSRCPGALVAVNVAGLDDLMFSDTLFGHNKGSFTGANNAREGLVSKADKGTLFLDEIGDLAESSQIKLLRLIQEQEYYRLGADTPLKSSARLVIATNRDLRFQLQQGAFRKDLYYRLCTHMIRIPPLRERPDDIPLLLDHFISDAAQSMGRCAPSYPRELVTLLSTYWFPGNVRELQAIVFDAVARNSTGKLSLESFKEMLMHDREQNPIATAMFCQLNLNTASQISFNRFPTLAEADTHLINRALELARGNQRVAALLLGISRQALNKRLRRSC